jgi:hypothetical protein
VRILKTDIRFVDGDIVMVDVVNERIGFRLATPDEASPAQNEAAA